MNQQLTRNNHYVPVWYQKGFLAPGDPQLCYLDTAPEQRHLPNGRIVVIGRVITKREPGGCFCKLDLYTTQLGPNLNDEIERYLFGTIDSEGAKAVRAFISGDQSTMHRSFRTFFEYLDAQKLRTPKGLDWIKSRYPTLTQRDLMREMQGLRLMNCTMWSEGVREIVSARNSDVKFIVTDHPVTIYNAAFPPGSSDCGYPADPSIELVGSQTVFALNADTCLILTHLEYAEKPDIAVLTVPRTNARYIGQSLVRTDAFIRKRELAREEVVAVNYLLKCTAKRYVAAADTESLYPEQSYSGTWKDIAKILLPRDDLWQFGGEIYVGYADGSTRYQDAFGRSSGAHEYLKKKLRKIELAPNDPCGCGNGRKFKQCCKHLSELDRPSWDVYGIRERNLMFCRAVEGILGLNTGKTWKDVQRELSDEQVKRIHEAFGSLWPVDTDLVALLPRPFNNTFRAVYLGMPDARTVANTITGWLPFFDELVVAHPFINPTRIRPEYSPTKSPSKYKEQTLKNVFLLLILEPYIDAGYVHLVPDPGDFNSEFSSATMKMATERSAGWKPQKNEMQELMELAYDDHGRALRRLSKESLRRRAGRILPKLTGKEVEEVVAHMKTELEEDPLALLQPVELGNSGQQLWFTKGYNLEVAMFLTALTGSVIYTNLQTHWKQLHHYTSAVDPAQVNDTWKELVETAKTLTFPIDLDWKAAFESRQNGKFGQMREVMRRVAQAIREGAGSIPASQLTAQLKQAEKATRKEWAKTASTTQLDGRLEISVPKAGFQRNEIMRLLVTFGRVKVTRPTQLAFLIRT